MVSHQVVWTGIDALARRHGLSVSALAKRAGLDPTAFNPSKRTSKDGRERWPSFETIAKILDATGETLTSFAAESGVFEQPQRAVPLLGLAQAGSGGFFDSAGLPTGQGWDEVPLPNPGDGTYALEVAGDSMLPLYRDGDTLVLSPTAQLRRGDRVVVRTRDGEVLAKVLHRQTPKTLELHSLNPDHPPRVLEMKDVESVARIIWASQ